MSNAASRDAPPGSYVANHAAGTLAHAHADGQRRAQLAGDVGPRSKAHFLASGGEDHAGTRAATDGRAFGGAIAATEDPPDDRTRARADADLRRVFTLGGRREM